MSDELTYPSGVAIPREFYVPGGEGSVAASLDAWRAFATEAVGGITERKVQRLVYHHQGNIHVSEVGYLEHDGTAEWLVTAIFEPHGAGGPWSICIVRFPNGKVVSREIPIMVSKSEVIEILDFLPSEKI